MKKKHLKKAFINNLILGIFLLLWKNYHIKCYFWLVKELSYQFSLV